MEVLSVQAFEKDIARRLSALGMESTFTEGVGAPQIGDTLRILFPVTPAGDAVITELMVTGLSPEIDLLHVYSTVVVEIGPRYDALVRKLVSWNARCPLGAYGIYEEERQLYHKYSYPIPRDCDPEDLAGLAMTLLELIHEVLAETYREAETYAAEAPEDG